MWPSGTLHAACERGRHSRMFLQQVIGGLATGSIYALVALGFVLIFKATDVVNFAQGEVMMVSAFFTRTVMGWVHPHGFLTWTVVALLTILFAALFGALLERIIVKAIFAGTWALSAVVSGIAGFLAAPILLIDTNMGSITIKGFAGAVLGGWGSIPGAIIGGMSFGVLENLATVYLPSWIKHVAAFLVLLGVLMIKPDGLLGFTVKKV